MEHLYIENGNKQLYSVYHEPKTGKNNNAGIILCNPIGQEYIRCHKLYVNLANNLAMQGYHVLRFDYYGTGDSLGKFTSVRVSTCLEEIGVLIKELKDLCSIKRIFLFGVRLGANLSLIYSQINRVDGLILWNPIKNGCDYLKEIDRRYENWLSGSFTKEKRNNNEGLINFGYLFSSSLIKDIKSISINNKFFKIDIPILLIENDDFIDNNELPNVTIKNPVNKGFWLKRENEMEKSMVPLQEMNFIFNWINDI